LNLKIIFIAFFLFFCITSCVFLPKTAADQKYNNQCKMATKKLTLKADVNQKYSVCDGGDKKDELLICLVASGVVASASLIVSGSIV
jgi:hypothetical protein